MMSVEVFVRIVLVEGVVVRRVLSVVLVVTCLLACCGPLLADDILDGVVVEVDVVYGMGGDVELKLDLTRPAEGEGPFPAIVYVHGGGWRFGSRGTYYDDIQRAAQRGYVAVSVTYRLTDPDDNNQARVPFPAQIQDAKCAVRWLRANAQKYHVDPNRIGVTGGSAGGHLSLLVGVTDASHGLDGDGGNAETSSRVQAVVNYFGPTDMAQLHATSPGAAALVESLLAGPPTEQAAAYALASPIAHASSDDPPVLTIHGDSDQLVPFEQATRFDEAMRKVGAQHTVLAIEGSGHGFRGEDAQRAEAATFEFFDRHLKMAR
jgi:acetyl esterase/lipase